MPEIQRKWIGLGSSMHELSKRRTYLERQGQIVWSNLFDIRGREIVVATVVDKLDSHVTWLSVKPHNLFRMGQESSLLHF